MEETPSYCQACGHRFLVHDWRHPMGIGGRCLVPGCCCGVFVYTRQRPACATDEGVEHVVYGRKELRPREERPC